MLDRLDNAIYIWWGMGWGGGSGLLNHQSLVLSLYLCVVGKRRQQQAFQEQLSRSSTRTSRISAGTENSHLILQKQKLRIQLAYWWEVRYTTLWK